MKSIVELNLKKLEHQYGSWGIERLKSLLLEPDCNFWEIKKELGISPIVSKLLIANFPLFIRLTEEKKSSLRLVYVKAA